FFIVPFIPHPSSLGSSFIVHRSSFIVHRSKYWYSRLRVHQEPLLVDVAIILLAAFPLLFLGRRFHIPEVLSYIVAGIVIGPHALGLISDASRVQTIAEVGVALILFFIGLHVPVARLRSFGRTAFLAGPVQMGLTATPAAALAVIPGRSFIQGLFYEFL